MLQTDLLADRLKNGQRAPGRARVDRIIASAIALLKDHKQDDISIAMIAGHGKMTRTSVYAHFASVNEVFEQVSIRFIKQTGLFVEQYVRRRSPGSVEQLVTLMILGVQEYFNQPVPHTAVAVAQHIPFQVRKIVKDFDKVAVLPYHTLWKTCWPIEPFSENDPFRLLVVLQSAIFDVSIERHGIITDQFANEAIVMAIDFVRRAEARYGEKADGRSSASARIETARGRLAVLGDETLLNVAARQIEVLVETLEA